MQDAIDEATLIVAGLEKDLQKVNLEKDNLDKSNRQIQDEIGTVKKDSSAVIGKLSELRSRKARIQGDLSRINIEMDVIHEAEKNLAGYSVGAKQLLTMIRKGDIAGMSKALSGDLIIPENYETAITAALGDFLDAIIIQKEKDLEQALSSLESVQNARSTILSAVRSAAG